MREGSCHCGGVTVKLSGEPLDACYCHCSICRRSVGAPFIGVTVERAEEVEIVLAEGVELQSRSTSSYLTRLRCGRCGCAIANQVRTSRRPVDNVMTALFEGPFSYSRHIYYADRTVDVADDLPKHDGWAPPSRG